MTPFAVTLALLAVTPMQPRTITVSGSADVRVAPDFVQILLAVETADKTVARAKQTTDERVAKVLATAQRFGIEPKDLQTDRLSIDAAYDSSSYARREANGYVVRRSIAITLRDLKKFEDLMSAVVEAGTNRVEGLEFQTSALRKHRDAARAQALKAAREKATAMAAELGMKIGRPQAIQEYASGAGLWGYSGRAGSMAQNVSVAQGPAAEGSEGFAPGQIAVSASVSVTFDLE